MVMAATGPRPSERILMSPKAQVTVPVTRASAKPHMGCFRRSTRWPAIGSALRRAPSPFFDVEATGPPRPAPLIASHCRGDKALACVRRHSKPAALAPGAPWTAGPLRSPAVTSAGVRERGGSVSPCEGGACKSTWKHGETAPGRSPLARSLRQARAIAALTTSVNCRRRGQSSGARSEPNRRR